MIKLIKQLVDKKKTYYFSLSMGIDSVAAYFYLANKLHKVIPIHINHKLRPQNDLMEQKYIELCKHHHHQPIIFNGFDLKTESDCRDFRINSFEELAIKHKRATSHYNNNTDAIEIITAHHLNDWVESYLINCFRGQPENKVFSLLSDFGNFKIIHPFLLTKKKDFKQYLIRNNYGRFVVEDETNGFSQGSRRNWIRNFVIPEMKNQKISLEKYAKRSITKLTQELDSVKI